MQSNEQITIHTSRTNKAVKFEIGPKNCHTVTDWWSFESQTDISIRCIPSYYFTITSTMCNRMPKHLLKFAAMQRVLPLSQATGLEVFLDPVQLLHRQLSYTVLQGGGTKHMINLREITNKLHEKDNRFTTSCFDCFCILMCYNCHKHWFCCPVSKR